jgi:hypothetical protein
VTRRPERPAPEPPEGLIAQNPDQWVQVWRRVITTTPTKAVCYAAASFADWETGAKVRPGNPMLARIYGCSTKSVERAFAFLRDNHLMWRYHHGRREGDADEYRLTIPEDVTNLPLLTPEFDDPSDSQSGADSQSAPDTESVTGADLMPGPVDNQAPVAAAATDSQSGADPESLATDTQSGALPTQGLPISTGDLPTDLYNLANTSPATAGVEGGGDPAEGGTGFAQLPKCNTCGGSAQSDELKRNDGNCNWCAPPLAAVLNPELVGLVTNLVPPGRRNDAWPQSEPEDAAC